MKKVVGIICVVALGMSASAQKMDTYRLNNLDPNKEYDSYSLLKDPIKNEQPDVTQATVETYGTSLNGDMVIYTIESWCANHPREDSVIQQAINYEFALEGMDQNTSQPDMFIQYHIYEEDYAENDAYMRSIEEYDYDYPLKEDLISNLDDGTLVVSVIDRETGESVWEGFAYDAYDENGPESKNGQKLTQAMDALLGMFIADMRG